MMRGEEEQVARMARHLPRTVIPYHQSPWVAARVMAGSQLVEVPKTVEIPSVEAPKMAEILSVEAPKMAGILSVEAPKMAGSQSAEVPKTVEILSAVVPPMVESP
jgi:hypothetical protein